MTDRKAKVGAFGFTAAGHFETSCDAGASKGSSFQTKLIPYEVYMKLDRIALTILATTLLIPAASSAFAQDAPKPADKPTAKQDLDKAGTDTKNATKKTGHVIAKGTKTAAKDTGKGTDAAAKDTAKGTKTVAKDTADGTKVAAKDTAKGTKVAAKDTAKGAKTVGKDTAKGAKKIVHPLTKGTSKDAAKADDKTTTPQ
jgi:hypothetical protein